MDRRNETRFNTRLAFILAVIGLILFGLLMFALYLTPATTFAVVNSIDVKTMLLGFGFMLIAVSGSFFYWAFHTPPVRRFAALGGKVIFSLSAISGCFSIFGWPRIKSLTLNFTDGLNGQFQPSEVVVDVSSTLAVCFTGISAIILIYLLIGFIEEKLGCEL